MLYTLGKVDGSKGGKLGVDILNRRLIYVELLKTEANNFNNCVCGCVSVWHFIFCILMSYLSQVPSHGTATPGTALLVLHAPRATRVTRPAQPARIRIPTSVRVTRGTAE